MITFNWLDHADPERKASIEARAKKRSLPYEVYRQPEYLAEEDLPEVTMCERRVPLVEGVFKGLRSSKCYESMYSTLVMRGCAPKQRDVLVADGLLPQYAFDPRLATMAREGKTFAELMMSRGLDYRYELANHDYKEGNRSAAYWRRHPEFRLGEIKKFSKRTDYEFVLHDGPPGRDVVIEWDPLPIDYIYWIEVRRHHKIIMFRVGRLSDDMREQLNVEVKAFLGLGKEHWKC